MKYVIRVGLVLIAIAALSLAYNGWPIDNEKVANIQGTPPEPGTYPKSQADMSPAMKGAIRPAGELRATRKMLAPAPANDEAPDPNEAPEKSAPKAEPPAAKAATRKTT